MARLNDDLKSRMAFPPPCDGPIEVVETHISWVFLRERDVFKVKKPVDLGFLDFSTPALRKEACEAEVELNRRLAPEVYLGIVPITRTPDGRHSVQGPGETVDWAVHMVRLPARERADQVLARGGLGIREIDLIARRLTEFHAAARCDAETRRFGTVAAIEANVRENFEQARARIADYLRPVEAERVEKWQLSFLARKRALFDARIGQGRVRDGHGDLRLQQLYLSPEGRITVLDCIEFNDRFRFADVASDLAFLSMDLASHGRVDLAERLIASYAREANDYDLYPIVDFYQSYRAYVRGKVADFLAANEGAPEATRIAARHEARRYFVLALSACQPPLVEPALLVVGGLIASGKSTVADWLGARIGAPVIDADRTRKSLLGVSPLQPVSEQAWTGAYDPRFTEKVYGEVLRRAGLVLDSGRPVILDASFRTAGFRARARSLAEARGIPFRFIECEAPEAVCRERLLERDRKAGVSDARAGLLGEFSARFEPVGEYSQAEHLKVNTSQPFERVQAQLAAELRLWPERLTA